MRMKIKVKNYKDVEGDRLGEGTSMRWVVSHEDGAENFYMRIVEAQPGSDGPPFHHHDYEHEMYILEGEGILVGDEGEIPVKPGDCIYIPPNSNHTIRHPNGLRFI
jgi:quercetin dioxygenase-like cupin family protein